MPSAPPPRTLGVTWLCGVLRTFRPSPSCAPAAAKDPASSANEREDWQAWALLREAHRLVATTAEELESEDELRQSIFGRDHGHLTAAGRVVPQTENRSFRTGSPTGPRRTRPRSQSLLSSGVVGPSEAVRPQPQRRSDASRACAAGAARFPSLGRSEEVWRRTYGKDVGHLSRRTCWARPHDHRGQVGPSSAVVRPL